MIQEYCLNEHLCRGVPTTNTTWFGMFAGDCHMISINQTYTDNVFQCSESKKKYAFQIPILLLGLKYRDWRQLYIFLFFSAVKVSKKKCHNLESNVQYSGA